jgi:hypothetical protein
VNGPKGTPRALAAPMTTNLRTRRNLSRKEGQRCGWREEQDMNWQCPPWHPALLKKSSVELGQSGQIVISASGGGGGRVSVRITSGGELMSCHNRAKKCTSRHCTRPKSLGWQWHRHTFNQCTCAACALQQWARWVHLGWCGGSSFSTMARGCSEHSDSNCVFDECV